MDKLVFKGTFVSYLQRLWPVIVATMAVFILTVGISWQIIKPVFVPFLLLLSALVLSYNSDSLEPNSMYDMMGIDTTQQLEMLGSISAFSGILVLFAIAVGLIALWQYILESRYFAEKTELKEHAFVFHGGIWGIIKISLQGFFMMLGAAIVSVIVALLFGSVNETMGMVAMLVLYLGSGFMVFCWIIQRMIQWFTSHLELTGSDEAIVYEGSFWRLSGVMAVLVLVIGVLYTIITFISTKIGSNLGTKIATEGLTYIKTFPLRADVLFSGLLSYLLIVPIVALSYVWLLRFITKNISMERYTLQFLGSIKSILLIYLVYASVAFFLHVVLQLIAINLALSLAFVWIAVVFIVYMLIYSLIAFYLSFRVGKWAIEGVSYEEQATVVSEPEGM